MPHFASVGRGRTCAWPLAMLVLLALATSVPSSATAAIHAPATDGYERLSGHVLGALSRAVPRGAAVGKSSVDTLVLTLTFRRHDASGFEAFLRDVYDPASAHFRRFLTPAALADRFGPTASVYDQTADYLRRHGLELVKRTQNRMTLTVRGTRSAVERAFQVTIGDYALDDRTFYANDTDPALPSGIAMHVHAIGGLSDYAEVHGVTQAIREGWASVFCSLLALACPELAKVDRDQIYKKCLGWAKGGYYGAVEIALLKCEPQPTPQPTPLNANPTKRTTLVPPAGSRATDGTGQKIGIVAFDTLVRSDVEDFVEWAGLPSAALSRLGEVHVNGGATPGANQDEVLLDVDAALSLAPGAEIIVYDAPFTGAGTSFQSVFNAMIDDGVTIISNSWAYCENQTTAADVTSIDAILAGAAAAGVSVFSASGDTGSTCLNGSANTVAVPAGSPNLTAVGGTTASPGTPNVLYGSETWWDGTGDAPPTGQGGFGLSQFFTRPAYQDALNGSPMRSVPDVVVNADPATGGMICQASKGGCPSGLFYGGTSVAAPIWAAFAARLNERFGVNLGLLNPLLYPFAGTDAFNSPASLGTDFAHVGLGSPNLNVIELMLAGASAGTTDAALSEIGAFAARSPGRAALPESVPADGTSTAYVAVGLRDAADNNVTGNTVTLTGNPGHSAVIGTASGPSSVNNGTVVFEVTNLTAEDVTFTATDTTDVVVLDDTVTVKFSVPPAASAGIAAFPTTVTANGADTTTITVTLEDSLGRGTPDKEVRLAQGDGHSLITGPIPSVTDVNGEIAFTATNVVNETVTYSAIDVTDGDLPVPGSVDVTFDSGAGTTCGSAATLPTGMNGYAVSAFATGFTTGSLSFGGINFGTCVGASVPSFQNGHVFVANALAGDLIRFGADGGAVTAADVLDTHGPTLGQPVFGPDGKLYAPLVATTGNFDTGAILELDPETGAEIRTVASNLRCPHGLVVDPLSGDLFYDDFCFDGGADDPAIHRVRNPASGSPTVEVYATLPDTPNGRMAFASNGSLYVVVGYTDPAPLVMRVSGTDGPAPPTITEIEDISSFFWVNVAEEDANGEATKLVAITSDGVELVDITQDPPTSTIVAEGMGGGEIGPDGCLYSTTADAIFQLTDPGGGCSFVPSTALPRLRLEPATTSPSPAQGTSVQLTATFHDIAVPSDTPVFFQVTGANFQAPMARTNGSAEAVLSLEGQFVGDDVITASATVNGTELTSNEARITWDAGKHLTFVQIAGTSLSGPPGETVEVSAALTDVSAGPATAVVGETIDFDLDGAQCSDATDVDGVASCQLDTGFPGPSTLTASFAGTGSLNAASSTRRYDVVAVSLGHFVGYKTKTTRGTTKFRKFGPVTLADRFGTADYEIKKATDLLLPADKNGEGFTDEATHLATYAVKRLRSAPRFQKQTDLTVTNQCGTVVLTATKPVSVLLPVAKDPNQPTPAPDEANHNVDHFLCYKAKVQRKLADGTKLDRFPKGVQVDAVDQFQSRRYDLKKPELFCTSMDKSGDPTVLAGPAKGSPKPITPAAVRNPDSHLLCYKAKTARKLIEQARCGPAVAKDRGTKISPKQAKHAKRVGVHVTDQFGARQLDTKREQLVCIPSTIAP